MLVSNVQTELLCRVEVPRLPKGAAGVYLKHAVTPEHLAMVGVAVWTSSIKSLSIS